jgi:hypothetical protein
LVSLLAGNTQGGLKRMLPVLAFKWTDDGSRSIMRSLHDRQVSDSMLETALGRGDGAA